MVFGQWTYVIRCPKCEWLAYRDIAHVRSIVVSWGELLRAHTRHFSAYISASLRTLGHAKRFPTLSSVRVIPS